ncbi:MAG: hypothetical protein ACE5FL_04975 [Myxococcota bacterium]
MRTLPSFTVTVSTNAAFAHSGHDISTKKTAPDRIMRFPPEESGRYRSASLDSIANRARVSRCADRTAISGAPGTRAVTAAPHAIGELPRAASNKPDGRCFMRKYEEIGDRSANGDGRFDAIVERTQELRGRGGTALLEASNPNHGSAGQRRFRSAFPAPRR